MTEYFVFFGYVGDSAKKEYLASLDVGYSEDYLGYLTHKFNLSAKVEEYMLAGVPVVTGTQGDKAQVIANKNMPCGICIEPLNESISEDFERYLDDLTVSIAKILQDSSLRSELKNNCLIVAENLFSSGSIRRTLQSVFSSLSA